MQRPAARGLHFRMLVATVMVEPIVAGTTIRSHPVMEARVFPGKQSDELQWQPGGPGRGSNWLGSVRSFFPRPLLGPDKHQ
jgi:hypothetical protein